MRRLVVEGVVAIATFAIVACSPPPPSPTAPTIPAGIGVALLNDAGGTNEAVFGAYTPAFQRFVTLDGVTTGPTPAGPGPYPSFVSDPDATPDGTARYPWNGFAGEGITLSTAVVGGEQVDQLTFPGGECSVGTVTAGTRRSWITPSPDGNRVAFLASLDNGPQSIEIRSLLPGTSCPLIVTAPFPPAGGHDVARGPFVWRPDSTAVMYMHQHSESGESSWSVDRLDATALSIPSTVLDSGTDVAYPLGWSIVNRLLVWRLHVEAGGDVRTDLLTTPVGGGAQRILNSATYPSFAVSKWSFGFYIPGTTDVAMAELGGSMCTNECPYQFPLLRLTVRADVDQHLDTVYGYLGNAGVHNEPVGNDSPPTYVVAPNSGMIERFTH